MDGATEFIGKFFESVKVELVVLLAVETDGAVVAALDDMPGNSKERRRARPGM